MKRRSETKFRVKFFFGSFFFQEKGTKGGTTLKEEYIEVSRRGGGGSRAAKPGKQRRKAGSAFLGVYKALVFLAALVVIGYVGFSLWARPPERAEAPKPPAQTGGQPVSGQAGAAAGEENPSQKEQGHTRRDGVYNVFLAAADAGGTRTDTMMVACYDIPNQKVGIVSVPRDTLVERSKGDPHLVYGPGGVEGRVADVSAMLGIPIDYYVKVDLDGFITLVDYLKGVDFYVPCDMDYDDPTPGQDLHIHYKEGMQHLNGQQVMEVARFRKNNPDPVTKKSTGYSDVGRTQTQQKLLLALAKKILSWGSLTKIKGFIDIFNQYVDTDLKVEDMAYFASQALSLEISSAVSTATLEGRGDGIYNGKRWCFELDPDKTLETVNALINPYNEPMTAEDLDLGKAQKYSTP